MKHIVRCIVATIALAIIVPLASATHGGAQDLGPPIRIGTGGSDASTALIYAVQTGFYKRAGLNVELVKVAGGAVAVAALSGGSLEVGAANPTAVVAAIAKGLPFTIIGSISNYSSASPDQGLVVSSAAQIATAKDLVGKTLAAVSLQDMGTIATLAWLDKNGVDSKSVKYIELPGSATLAALEENRVVGTNINEPIFSQLLASGKVHVLGYPFDVIGKSFPESVLFASTSWVGAHRDLVARFLRATQQASTYVAAHEDEASPYLIQFGGLDPSTFGKIHHPARQVAISDADLQPVIDIAAKYNLIPRRLSAQEMICTCALRR